MLFKTHKCIFCNNGSLVKSDDLRQTFGFNDIEMEISKHDAFSISRYEYYCGSYRSFHGSAPVIYTTAALWRDCTDSEDRTSVSRHSVYRKSSVHLKLHLKHNQLHASKKHEHQSSSDKHEQGVHLIGSELHSCLSFD